MTQTRAAETIDVLVSAEKARLGVETHAGLLENFALHRVVQRLTGEHAASWNLGSWDWIAAVLEDEEPVMTLHVDNDSLSPRLHPEIVRWWRRSAWPGPESLARPRL